MPEAASNAAVLDGWPKVFEQGVIGDENATKICLENVDWRLQKLHARH